MVLEIGRLKVHKYLNRRTKITFKSNFYLSKKELNNFYVNLY